jgi:hypothetical protein
MYGETFFYDSHPPERVLSMLHRLGFELIVSEFMNMPTTGRDKDRYAIVARMLSALCLPGIDIHSLKLYLNLCKA